LFPSIFEGGSEVHRKFAEGWEAHTQPAFTCNNIFILVSRLRNWTSHLWTQRMVLVCCQERIKQKWRKPKTRTDSYYGYQEGGVTSNLSASYFLCIQQVKGPISAILRTASFLASDFVLSSMDFIASVRDEIHC